MNNLNLNDYVCIVPFQAMEIQEHNRFLCCASWLKKYLPPNTTPIEAWESLDANEIRKSVLDGSFKYCDKTQCPYLHQLTKFQKHNNTNTIYRKNEVPSEIKEKIDSFIDGKLLPPSTIQFSFDRTCNLKCPSCRIELIVEDSNGIDRVKKTIDLIEKQYGNTIKSLYITGSGDPFVSVGFRDFLRNFDKQKWPKLESIHLHTNATKWNKKMWNSMRNIHPYVKSCEISIDAATKDTYENKVRIGGNWDELIDNLKFIATIKNLKNIKTSFVIQKNNYKEMENFYQLMTSIFGSKVNVFYGKINNWGTFTNSEYLDHKIWDESHPLYNDFVKELNSFVLKDKVWHNLQEFVNPTKNLI